MSAQGAESVAADQPEADDDMCGVFFGRIAEGPCRSCGVPWERHPTTTFFSPPARDKRGMTIKHRLARLVPEWLLDILDARIRRKFNKKLAHALSYPYRFEWIDGERKLVRSQGDDEEPTRAPRPLPVDEDGNPTHNEQPSEGQGTLHNDGGVPDIRRDAAEARKALYGEHNDGSACAQ